MTYQKLCALVAAAAFLIGLVLVYQGGHAQNAEELLFGGLTFFAVAHT
jgi:hypothetical protein